MFDFFKRRFARWEAIGEWCNGEWHLWRASKGLMDWLHDKECQNPDVWSEALRTGRRFIVRGEHFDYRITPRNHNEPAFLLIERGPK